MKMKKIRAWKANVLENLVISKIEGRASFRFLAVQQQVFGYFKGENFFVNVGPVERNISASDVYYTISPVSVTKIARATKGALQLKLK